MTVGTRSGGGALRREEGCVPLLQALDEKSSKLEDFWNAKTEVVRNKLDRHGAADTSWIESIADCPVYYPTKEDFAQDPLHYIQKIAAEASKFGMCKIVSPVVAHVPAGVVLSKEQSGFKFTTRIQPMRLSSWDKDDKITFPMSGRNYTLTEYEKMANRVFSRKFSTAGNLPPRFIEAEFWKELAVGKTRTVEYATDVDGSAFSSSSTDPLGQSKWNLKRISRLPYSILRLLEEPIPGVTEPMLYIGMLFSMFSWHIEDHYLYSINYQHCGAPKTWYGVPGEAALCFEKVVQEHVYDTELLRDTGKGAELDLLLEKTTMFTPKLLSEQGVPVFKAVQYPGEFIVTFPRAYHAGFSHGFNCGEAVNFAMADWFSLGAEACLRYECLNRLPLLPHEMLLCKEAAIISQFNGTRHDSYSCDLQAHVKVAFVVWMRSLLQSMSSFKRRGAKMTTSNETRVLCGLCKHICHIAYTSCACFPEATCFNHGDFFSTCTCKGERMIVLKDDFTELESLAQKYESEVEIRSRVQKLLSQNDSGNRNNIIRVAVNTQFEKSSLKEVKNSVECYETQTDREKADNVVTIAQVELSNGATSSDCRQGQEEEFSDTEVVQFKRRKVSLPQSKRFQVDEQEIVPEKFMVLTPQKSDYLKVESSRSSDRNQFFSLKPLDLQTRFGVAEVNKATQEAFDTSSDSEVLRKRKKKLGLLVKVKRKRSTATLKDSVPSAEFDVDCAADQVAEIKNEDCVNSDLILHSMLSYDDGIPIVEEGPNQKAYGIPASDETVLEEKEMEHILCKEIRNNDEVLQGSTVGELMKADSGVSALVNEDHMKHLSSKAGKFETDSPVETIGSSTDESNLTEDLAITNSRSAASVTGSLTDESKLMEDLPIPSSRNIASKIDTRESVSGSKVNDANGEDDACVTTPKAATAYECETDLKNENFLLSSNVNGSKVDDANGKDDICVTRSEAAIADEGKQFFSEGNCSSCEYRECKTDSESENFLPSTDVNGSKINDAYGKGDACSVAIADQGKCAHTEGNCPSCEYRDRVIDLKSENFLLSSPAEAQPLVDLAEVQKARNNLVGSGAKIMPFRDCDKSDAASFSSLEPKRGLVIHLNRKVEQIHKKVVAGALLDEEKNSICENLMEHVDILEGQSGGSAWCLDQEVVSSDSNQNDCKWSSPSGPSSFICGGHLIKKDLKYGKSEEFSQDEFDLKPEGLLEIRQLIVGQQEAGKLGGLQGDFGPKHSKSFSHFKSDDYVKGGRICEGEISNTQHAVAMPSVVRDCTSVDLEEEHRVGVLEVIDALDAIDALPCVKNAIPPAGYCEWQRAKWQRPEIFTNQVTGGPSSAGVCVPRDDCLQEFPLSDTRSASHSSRLDSSNFHQSEGHTPDFVDKCLHEGQNFRVGDIERHWGKSLNLSNCRFQGRTDLFSRQATGHAAIMSNNNHRFGPSHNYRPRSLHRNHHPFQNDNTRGMKNPHVLQKRPFSRCERRPRRHYSQGWRGARFENESPSRADNPRVKGVSDGGFSAASSSAGSVHVEGYDPMKWEIYPGANPWHFSCAPPSAPFGWVERRP